jgi:hypothetical protein
VAALLRLVAGLALLIVAALRSVAALLRRLLALLVLLLHVWLLVWVAPPVSGGDGLRGSSEVATRSGKVHSQDVKRASRSGHAGTQFS